MFRGARAADILVILVTILRPLVACGHGLGERSSAGASTSASAPRRSSSAAACHTVFPIGTTAIRQPAASAASSIRVRVLKAGSTR
jgi:hypothetical protein